MRKDYTWDEARAAIRVQLGDAEIRERVNALDDYHRWETVVSWQDVSLGGEGMTARQARAWAFLCETIPDSRVFGGTIRRQLTDDELAFLVCGNELARRADAELLNRVKDTP